MKNMRCHIKVRVVGLSEGVATAGWVGPSPGPPGPAKDQPGPENMELPS